MSERPATAALGAAPESTAPGSEVPLPLGFGIELDRSARALSPDLWFGGSPSRVLRLSSAGRSALLRLRAEGVRDVATGRLARRFTDAGLAQPVPPALDVTVLDVTVLVPVLDRPEALDRCLDGLGRHHPVVVVDDGSRDAGAIAAVTRAHGARLVRLGINGGPAVARNAGLEVIDTEFVAFLDSDCVPPDGWVAQLAPQLADPLVAAAAPRIMSSMPDRWPARYYRSRGGLDLGEQAGRVVPRSRIAYVPTAALVVRTDALGSVARRGYVFDPALRFGEDVDLIWRLHEAGWRIRYDPAITVDHWDPESWTALLRRRFRYGTSAAPLGRAHPDAVAPLIVHPWATATVVALLARRPVVAALAFGATVHTTSRRLRAAQVPTAGTTRAMAGAVGQTWLGLGRYLTQFAAPALAVGAFTSRRPGRRLAALSLLLGPSITAWVPDRGGLDPVRFVAARLADEVAYGLGVWAGCVRHRTLRPLRPALARTRQTTTTCHATTCHTTARRTTTCHTPRESRHE